MFWNDDEKPQEKKISDDVLDILFVIEGRELPVDHTHALSKAILQQAPWLNDHQDEVAILPIHLAGSQNGWERPDPALGQKLQLSRRTKLTLRAPKTLLERIKLDLVGKELEIGDCQIRLGKVKTRLLSNQTIIFSRGIVLEEGENEDEMVFLQRIATTLAEQDIRIKKALCGKTRTFDTPEGPILTRSLMIADLPMEHSLYLQIRGVGPHRLMGCGVFLPHKGIDAVKESQGDK